MGAQPDGPGGVKQDDDPTSKASLDVVLFGPQHLAQPSFLNTRLDTPYNLWYIDRCGRPPSGALTSSQHAVDSYHESLKSLSGKYEGRR